MAHEERKHALLSASGASRWLNCPPSVRLEENFPEKPASVYAEEGTLAHEFGDLNLQFLTGKISKTTLNKELKKLRKHELYYPEMEDEVKKYTDICMETFETAKKTTKDAVALVEERLDYSHIVQDGFGTGDFMVIADGVMEVIDLKFGKGLKVEAEDNPQLKLYGLGGLNAYALLYDIRVVKLSIIQPRLNHFSTFSISVDDLEKWAEEQVKPKALLAYKGEGEQTPGPWCKWCKAKPVCKAMAKKAHDLAAKEFAEPKTLTDEEILEVYNFKDVLVDWAQSVSEYMLQKALDGKEWEGLKVVEGRSLRKWLNESEVAETLVNAGYTADKFTTSKLNGIGKVEKLVGKKDFNKLLGEHVVKPEGKPTLVPESDKRPALGIEQAKQDFAE